VTVATIYMPVRQLSLS